VFPLSFLLYCAACDHEATEQGNPKLRARITGHNKNGLLRYRHSESRACARHTTSVYADVIEDDFARLVKTLSVHPDGLSLMGDIAVQSQFNGLGSEDTKEDLEAQKALAVAKHRRALKNNLIVFQTGDIEAEEYFRQKDYHERQIAHWESRTTDRRGQSVLLLDSVSRLLAGTSPS
jgi:hypothetical protein